MFAIEIAEDGTVAVEGRLDAAQAVKAQEFLDQVEGACVLDMAKLAYVSSAGLGVLLKTHKRLMGSGSGIKLVNVNNHIHDIFRYSGFDKLFEIIPAGD
ncbi:MAG: STAS domain-containing protein [Gammaproteobacteria bacterium]|nr:STAS domain-containing protein [Gammaproteobacteria bacterium]MBT8076721.1 STAS domain-containing protein [Gammaproteobacteria bacterium]NNK98938.1 STAS domain-containing protein [Xanthomonadales bacterium]